MFQSKRPVAIHPGEILSEEFMKPCGLTQEKLARDLHIPVQRVNLIVRGKRGVTAKVRGDRFRIGVAGIT